MAIRIPQGKTRRIFLYATVLVCIVIFLLVTRSSTPRPPIIVNFYTPKPQNQDPPPVVKFVNSLEILANSSKKEDVDVLLNTRKLTLFAVHELNSLVASSPNNPCAKTKSCPKWWANPIKILKVNTTAYPGFTGYEHQITFVADPGRIRFSVTIRQNKMDIGDPKGFNELEIIGNFTRAQHGAGNSLPVDSPPKPLGQSLNAYNAADNKLDPELFSWKREVSFMVGDYVDFGGERSSLYPISPGEQQGMSIIQDLYCGSNLKMLIMVSSAPPHFENRRVIRETYGSDVYLLDKQVRLVFLFGKVENQTLQTLLEEEAGQHDDLIQADFMDSYHNLSLSHLLMYNWIQTTCAEVGLPNYVFKADDDFMLNVEVALKVAYANPQYELIGCLYCGTRPIRDIAYMTKYYTPKYMYMSNLYVGYLSGVAYVLRTDIIPRMLRISLTTPMIHMDDEYMTGMLPRQIQIMPVGSNLFTYVRTGPDPCGLRQVAASAAESVNDIKVQWDALNSPMPSNCTLDRIKHYLTIAPLTEYDMLGCTFQ